MKPRYVPFLLGVAILQGCCAWGPADPPVYAPFETPSGVHVQDRVVPDSGPRAEMGDQVTIDYVLRLEDDTIADSSVERGQPISFVLGAGEVPSGLEQGIAGMVLRGSREIRVPPALGYGEAGVPPRIPPDAVLFFAVDLLELAGSGE